MASSSHQIENSPDLSNYQEMYLICPWNSFPFNILLFSTISTPNLEFILYFWYLTLFPIYSQSYLFFKWPAINTEEDLAD